MRSKVYTRSQIINIATTQVNKYWEYNSTGVGYSKPNGAQRYHRNTFDINGFAIWLFAKKRNLREYDLASLVFDQVINEPNEVGLSVEKGRTDRIYYLGSERKE